MPRKRTAGLPSRKQILDFIASSDQPAGKREISRAFGLSGQEKIDLKRLLKDMADEGLIDSSPGRAFHKSGGVPKVTVLRVQSVDDGGTVWAVPEQWHAETPPPRLRVMERGRGRALGIGDRVLARTEQRGQGFIAHPMKKLERAAELVLGVVRREGERFWLSPVDKRERRELAIVDLKDAEVGFYVRPGSELDKEARARGNSVYFPDRVVPMLPEELSADICSLKAGEDRAATACHLKIDREGTLKSWRFTRAKVRIAANIAYEDAQAAIDAAGEERVEGSSPVCSMHE